MLLLQTQAGGLSTSVAIHEQFLTTQHRQLPCPGPTFKIRPSTSAGCDPSTVRPRLRSDTPVRHTDPPFGLAAADHLDVGNNKKALQEAEKVLKKYPAIQCARALKSLVLLRLGRDDEAAVIIAKLAAEHPTDEGTLQVMTYCYKDQEERKWPLL